MRFNDDRNTINISSEIGSFSSRVYGWMAAGLALTASIAYAVYATGIYLSLMPFWWVWSLALFGIAIAISSSIQKISVMGATGLFLAYAGLEGIVFGTILPAFAKVYGGQVIWVAFATAALLFGMATLYGIFTRSDLTSMGKILRLGLFGLMGLTLLYVILSFFFPLTGLHLIISYLGLVLFIGLTAYDAQTIRQYSLQAEGNAQLSYKLSLIMALKMYINVVMLFWYLLQIFSSSSQRR